MMPRQSFVEIAMLALPYIQQHLKVSQGYGLPSAVE